MTHKENKRFRLEKVDKYHYNDGTFVEGTRVVLIDNAHFDPKYIGQSGVITERYCEHGTVLYYVEFGDVLEHIVYMDYVELDYKYYRKDKIYNILNEEI